MRNYMPLVILSVLVLFVVFLGNIAVEPIPVYAQDLLTNAPDLSDFNIYFSEASAELSQFDRSNAGISRYAGLLRLMGAELFTLEWRKGIPADADLIVIPKPTDDLTQDIVARLWAYLQRGGHILIFMDPLNGNGNASQLGQGLFELTWNDLGIQARSDVIVREGELRQINIVERNNTFSGEMPNLETQFFTRYVNPDHPITAGLAPMLSVSGEEVPANLNSLYFNSARSLEIDADLHITTLAPLVTPLVFTGDAGLYGESETGYANYLANGYVEYNVGVDSPPGDLILAAAYEKPADNARLVLIGDGDFIRNGAGFAVSPSYSGSFVYPANVQFMVRTTAWLLGVDPSNIEQLPTPAATGTATLTPTPTLTPTLTLTPTPTVTPAGQ